MNQSEVPGTTKAQNTNNTLSANNSNLNINNPGIKFYIEDPEKVIQRKIKKTYLIIVVAVLLAALGIFLAIQEIKKKANDMSLQESELYTQFELGSLNDKTVKAWEEISPFKEKIIEALPDQTNLLKYQSALEQAASSAGVQISVNIAASAQKPANLPSLTSSPSSTKTAKTFIGLDHTVEIKGNFTNFRQFLKNIENLPYYVLVNSFTVNSTGGINKDASITLSLKIYTK